jgi:hypothetical protein
MVGEGCRWRVLLRVLLRERGGPWPLAASSHAVSLGVLCPILDFRQLADLFGCHAKSQEVTGCRELAFWDRD